VARAYIKSKKKKNLENRWWRYSLDERGNEIGSPSQHAKCH